MQGMLSRCRSLTLLTASVLGVVASNAKVAEACVSGEPPPALVGYPEDGAVGVPTDVLPIYDIQQTFRALNAAERDAYEPSVDDLTSFFELVDDAGVVTPFVPSAGGGVWLIELVPSIELAPRTRYTVRTVAERSEGKGLQVSFTTGDGPYPALPEPPVAGIEHYTLAPDEFTSCTPWLNGTCVEFGEPAPGVYTALNYPSTIPYGTKDAYLSRQPWFINITGIDQGTPFDCIDLRTRVPNGALSEPVTLCREDGEMRDIRGSENIACTAKGVTQDGVLASELPLDEGCNMAGGSRSNPLVALLCGLSLVVLPLRRIRRRAVRFE